MCLYIKKGEKERTATEDMVVYKIIKNDNKSFWLNFQYQPNTLYRLRKKLKISEGAIHEGFHAYLFADVYKSYRTKYVKFIIPKGAKYYLGKNDDIVSTSIRSGNLVGIKD